MDLTTYTILLENSNTNKTVLLLLSVGDLYDLDSSRFVITTKVKQEKF